MKALNLNRLNIRTPYSVWAVDKQSYGFKTAYGVQYRIGFIADQTIWQHGAYEFGIINENRRPSPNDHKLRETIYAVIEEFFESNPEILLTSAKQVIIVRLCATASSYIGSRNMRIEGNLLSRFQRLQQKE